MVLFKCENCGGNIVPAEGKTYGICDSCGSAMTLPTIENERIANQLSRAGGKERMPASPADGINGEQIGAEVKQLSNDVFKAFEVVLANGTSQILLISRAANANTAYAHWLSKIKNNGVCVDFFPNLLSDAFSIAQPDGQHTALLIGMAKEEANNLRSLRFVIKTGKLDPKDIAWIWRRMVSAAAVCADLSIRFGFSPDMVYIEPEQHGYLHMSLGSGQSPASLTQSAEFMISLCDTMPEQMRRYFSAVSLAAESTHPKELLDDFDYVIDKLWGAREFHPFKYPVNWV